MAVLFATGARVGALDGAGSSDPHAMDKLINKQPTADPIFLKLIFPCALYVDFNIFYPLQLPLVSTGPIPSFHFSINHTP